MFISRKVMMLITLLLMFTASSLFAVDYKDYEPDNHPDLPPYDNDLLWERTFDDGTCFPWHTCEDSGGLVEFGLEEYEPGNLAFKLDVLENGENPWSAQMRHRGITMQAGHTYTIRFTIWADKDCNILAKVGQMGGDYKEYWNNKYQKFALTAGEKITVEQEFTAEVDDATCEFGFHAGGANTGGDTNTIYIDNLSIYDPQYTKPLIPITALPDVRVNQIGYISSAGKEATVVCDSTTPVEWNLCNAAGNIIKSGTTTVKGLDPDSEDFVHLIDFSDVTDKGLGYYFELPGVDSLTNYSHPFDIRDDIYSEMKFDALAYFYHNRSGIEIVMPYAGREDLTRPAGHIGVAPNTGDISVPTASGQASYSKDVSGGWYDAGDHGKYVVNGGVSLWTMQNQFEKAQINGLVDVAPYKDGGMNIPENANGIPDLLDESRWQMEFMLKMQVTEEEDPATAGMVHHKMGDVSWTALGLLPHEDPMDRTLRPVSTAATLNLAATAAQASRIWADYDAEFAAKCLDAAKKAWVAALNDPENYAPMVKEGLGPYNDSYVLDEFYWTACELYIATGDAEYKTYLEASPHYLEMSAYMSAGEDDGLTGAFTWGSTYGMGTLSLILVPNGLGETALNQAKSNISDACDTWLGLMDNQGYGNPNKPGNYAWGSNSFVVNIMIVFAYAYDFSGDIKYFSGMTESMDYLLGRNALDQSYVSGYGKRPLENPHHRFWAKQISDEFPAAPAGAFSGGPNSNFQDPTVLAAVPKDTPKQKVFIDHIDSWSTNEITINWNAPFAWVTCYLDEKSGLEKVTITNPEAGSKYPVGSDVTVEARVSTFGTVQSVSFYDGLTLLDTDSSAPYSYEITNAAEGSVDLIAKAELADGTILESPSTPIVFKVMKAPVVEITAPTANQADLSASEILTLEASASDSDGKVVEVQFLVDGVVVGNSISAPFSYNWRSTEGAHEITAIAIDDDGAKGYAEAVPVTIGPAKDIVVQYSCGKTDLSTQEIQGKFNLKNRGSDTVNLQDLTLRYYFTSEAASESFACYYSPIGSGNIIGTFAGEGDLYYLELSFNSVELAAGSESGEIQFVIRAGSNGYFNQEDDYSFGPECTAFTDYEKVALFKNGVLIWGKENGEQSEKLTVSLTSPAEGTVLSDSEAILMTANAVSNISGYEPVVTFYVDGVAVGSDASAPYSFDAGTLSEGDHTLKASAEKQDGTIVSSSEVTVSILVPSLDVQITSPLTGTVVDPGTDVTVTASVMAVGNPGDVTVTFYVDGVQIGLDSSYPYSAVIADIAEGTYQIQAVAQAGSLSDESAVVEIEAKVEPRLSINITAPADNALIEVGNDVTVTAAVDTNVTIGAVEFYNGTELVGSADSTPYSVTLTGLAVDSYTITAKVAGEGLNAEDSVSFEIYKTVVKPVVSITSPVNGSEFEVGEEVAITVAASDADGIVELIEIFVDGVKIGEGTGAVYTMTAGSHVISAKATDNDGETAVDEITIKEFIEGGDIEVKWDGNSWNSGFSGSLVITNKSTETISSGWILTFDLAPGHEMTSYWCATASQSGSTVTMENLDWNASIAPGQTVIIGMQGNHPGTFVVPTDFTVTAK